MVCEEIKLGSLARFDTNWNLVGAAINGDADNARKDLKKIMKPIKYSKGKEISLNSASTAPISL